MSSGIEASYFVGLDLGQQQDPSALVVLERRRPAEESTDPEHLGTDADKAYGGVLNVPAGPKAWAPPVDRTASYFCRMIHRWDLKTRYTVVAEHVAAMFARPPLSGATLVIDATGVGRPVVEKFRELCSKGYECPVCKGTGYLKTRNDDLAGYQMVCARCQNTGKIKMRARIVPVSITFGSGSAADPDGGWRVAKKELVSILMTLIAPRPQRLKIYPQLDYSDRLVRELETFKVKVTANANETFEAWRERDHDDLVLALALAAWVAEKGTKEFWAR